jgi:hypothetical protein
MPRPCKKDDKQPNYILFALAFVDKTVFHYRNILPWDAAKKTATLPKSAAQ